MKEVQRKNTLTISKICHTINTVRQICLCWSLEIGRTKKGSVQLPCFFKKSTDEIIVNEKKADTTGTEFFNQRSRS